jgi:hypothetical protein
MNKRQKALLTESVIIIFITIAAVVAMIHLKQWVSRTETIKVMEQLGQITRQYRTENGSMPSESDIKAIHDKLQGRVNLNKLQYRAQWLDAGSAPDEILAYIERQFRASFLSDGYVVLQLSGQVTWMSKEQFRRLLSQQRRLSPEDLQVLQDL